MPVYGKGRTHRKIPARKRLGQRIVREHGKRTYRERQYWNEESTSLSFVFAYLNFDKNWINRRFSQTRRPVVVLDWGCGKGIAITELAKQNPNAVCYGFSKDSYEEWQRNEHVKFIQDDANGLFRFLKDNSVDLIYSRWGLSNIQEERPFFSYIFKLIKKLKPGGIIVSDVRDTLAFEASSRFHAFLESQLKQEGIKSTKERNSLTVFEGNKPLFIVDFSRYGQLMQIKKF